MANSRSSSKFSVATVAFYTALRISYSLNQLCRLYFVVPLGACHLHFVMPSVYVHKTSCVTTVCMALWSGHRWFYKHYGSFQSGVRRIYYLCLYAVVSCIWYKTSNYYTCLMQNVPESIHK